MAKIPIAYDPAVIQEFASRLYSQASSIIFISTLLALIIGALLGLGVVATVQDDDALVMIVLLGMVVGGAIGFSRGKERAFKLKLEAQVALCQVKIEKNTSANHS